MVIYGIFGWITDALSIALLNFYWFVIIQGPLCIISIFKKLLDYLSGPIIYQTIFKTGNSFNVNNIPGIFWVFCIVGLVLLVTIFICQFAVLTFFDTKEIKNKLLTSVKMTGFSMVFLLGIPVGFFIFNQALMFFNAWISKLFDTGNISIADLIWRIGNADWKPGDGIAPSDFLPPVNIGNYNMFVETATTLFILYSYFHLTLGVSQKVFELFFLFIIGPIIAATMPNDNGKRMLVWKDLVINKGIAGSSVTFSYYVFRLVLRLILFGGPDYTKIWESGSHPITGLESQILACVILIGGGMFTLAAAQMMTQLVGESISVHDGKNSLNLTISALRTIKNGGAMAAGGTGLALKAAEKALGLGEKKDSDNKTMDNNKGGVNLTSKLSNRGGALGLLGKTLGGLSSMAGSTVYSAKKIHKNAQKKNANDNSSAITRYSKATANEMGHSTAKRAKKIYKGAKSVTIKGANKAWSATKKAGSEPWNDIKTSYKKKAKTEKENGDNNN